jgi:hypothetical protein
VVRISFGVQPGGTPMMAGVGKASGFGCLGLDGGAAGVGAIVVGYPNAKLC